MSVAFKELAGSPQEAYGPEGVTAQRKLLCAWEDRQALVGALLGDAYEFGGQARAGLPGRRGVVAVRIAIAPFDACPDHQGPFTDVARQLNAYSGQYAELTVDYELLDAGQSGPALPAAEPETFLDYRADHTSHYESLPSQSHGWQDRPDVPVPTEAFPSIRFPALQHSLTWHRAVRPPWSAIRRAMGCVNQAEFLAAPAESLLLEGIAVDREFLVFDAFQAPTFAWRVQYVFRERLVNYGGGQYGWNHAYRPLPADAPGYDRLRDGNGEPLYHQADFTTLFRYRPEVG